jgi:N-acetylglucosamine kinase-like BadF-type ATPase
MPRLVVGVDAGGTSTLAALAQDGEVVRTFLGPPANPSVCGIETASAIVADTIAAALDGALPHAIFVGAAGAGRPEVADGIRTSLESRFGAARVGVRDDAYIALRACVPDGDGAVLISGTGSIAYAVRGGVEFRSGGYGYLLGDDGSGFDIGSAAVRSALRALDERAPRDPFVDRVLAQIRATTVAEVLARVYGEGGGVAFVAGLAQLVLEAANEGDRGANKIVQSAAHELSEMGKSIVKRAGLSETGAPLVLAGSLLTSNSLLTFLLETRLKNDLPEMAIYKSGAEPVAGALAAARSL